MELARAFAIASPLRDGNVLVAGGYDGTSPNVEFRSAEIYDTVTGTWSAAANMNDVRAAAVSVRLPGGKIMVIGGENLAGPLGTAEIYDPRNNTWTETAPMFHAHDEDFVAFVLPKVGRDVHVLVAGGFDETGAASADAEIFSVQHNVWRETGSLNQARGEFDWVKLNDGDILVAGGVAGEESPPLASTEIYHVASGTWTVTGDLNTGRFDQGMVRLNDGRVLGAGGGVLGSNGLEYTATSEIWDPNTGQWTTTGDMTSPRSEIDHATVLLPNGQVLVPGGFLAPDTPQGSSDVYDPSTGTWSAGGDMSTARAGHAAAHLADGRILVIGGLDAPPGATASVDIYSV